MEKSRLEKEFYSRIPKARKINPVFRSFFDFMFEAHLAADGGKKVLNVYSSADFSGNREEVYREEFFKDSEYFSIDFWKDSFIVDGKPLEDRHKLPFKNEDFDVIVTTKNIMEHVSEPEKILGEFYRVLKPGGRMFLWSSFMRRQHQGPYDFFRFTEYGIAYMLNKTGFNEFEIRHAGGAMATFGEYAYFFQRGLGAPKIIEKLLDFIHMRIIQPVFFLIDLADNGYGRNLTQFFLIIAKKNKQKINENKSKG